MVKILPWNRQKVDKFITHKRVHIVTVLDTLGHIFWGTPLPESRGERACECGFLAYSWKLRAYNGQSSYPAEVRKWNFSPFFSAKDVVKFGVKIWWNFPRYVFQGLGDNGAFWMRLFYLQLRSFCLRFVFFTYGGGTVSKEDQTQFPDGGNRKQKRPNQFPEGGKP